MRKTIVVVFSAFLLYACSTTNKDELKVLKLRIDKLEDMVRVNAASIANNTERINSLDQRLLLIQKRLQKERQQDSFIGKIPPLSVILGDNATKNCQDGKQKATGATKQKVKKPTRVTIPQPVVQIEKKQSKTIPEKPAKTKQINASPNKKQDYKSFYKKALNAYMQFNYPKAIKLFNEFLKTYNTNDLTDNAIYWLACSYLRMNETNKAIELYKKLIKEYPYGATSEGGKTDAALYELIKIYKNDPKKRSCYEKLLLKRFPASSYAGIVRKMLSKGE